MAKLAREARRRAAAAKNSTIPATDTIWFIAIFALAFILRLLHLWQIESIPLFYHLAGDGRAYDEWAQRIAAGDWLGQGVFYQAPLYPYFLGLLQFTFGHNLWLIRLFQCVLGALSCALICQVGRSWFSRPAGIAAGFILACYAPAIFFDGLIEKSGLDLFLLAVLLVLVSHTSERPQWQRWLAAGAILGLLGLSRENALILVPVLLLWIGVHFPQETLQVRLRWAGLFCAGLVFVLVPVGLRNLTAGGEFKLTTSQFGANFYIGNNATADGTYRSIGKAIGEPQLEGADAARLAERALGRSLTPGEVSNFWLSKGLQYIRSEPAAWLGLIARKWLLVWNSREVEDSDDFYIYQRWSWLLTLAGGFNHFGFLAPLAATGLWLTRDRWRHLWLLYAMIAALAVSVAVFYVFGRYRFPLVALLALFAGVGVVKIASGVKDNAWRQSIPALMVLLSSALFVNWPVHGKSGPGPGGYNNLSNAFYKQGKVDAAIDLALKAIELEPNYGVAHFNLGNLYAGRGQFAQARSQFESALRIFPNYAEAWSNLGQLLAEGGDIEGGIRHFEKALALNPALSRAYLNLGVALAKQGKTEAAIAPLQTAAKLNLQSPQASYYLGSIYAAQNRYNEAEEFFNRALQIEPSFVPAHQSLAQLFKTQGKKAAALEHYREADRLMRQGGVGGTLR